MSFIWAMKMEATVTNNAVPSMLTVAPIGRTNLEIRGSTRFLSIQRKVMGRAAALETIFVVQCINFKIQVNKIYGKSYFI
jgi:hypothetical protein